MNKNAKNINKLYSLKKNGLKWLLLLPTVLSLIICYIYPIADGMVLVFFKTKGVEVVEFVGLENFKNVVTDTLFTQTLWNTVMYVVWSFVIGAIPPILVAIVLNEIVHCKEIFKTLMYIPAIAPALAVSLIWMNVFSPNPAGLMNLLLSVFGESAQGWLTNPNLTIPLIVVSMTWSGMPGTVIIYLAALQSVNQDLYEAASLDGAGIFKRIFKITIPHIAPMMLLMQIRQVIGVFQIMDQPMVMTDGGPNNASISMELSMFKTAFTYGQMDKAVAMGAIIFLLLIWVSFLYFYLDKKLSE